MNTSIVDGILEGNTIYHLFKFFVMRKTFQQIVATVIVLVALSVLAGCSKESKDCRVCQSRNPDGEVIAEKEVCSDQEEETFRIQQEGRPVTCQ